MKKILTPHILFAAAAISALGLPVSASAADEARAVVTFQDPEKFTDIKDTASGTDKGREFYLKELRTLVEKQADVLLPEGQKLEMTFTDIDLAGDYLPMMASGHDVRVMKDIYRPAMKFSYKITDASGAVVKEGTENISDINYLNTIGTLVGRGEALYYDKGLLLDWLRKTLR